MDEIIFKNIDVKLNEFSSFWPWSVIALEVKYVFPKILKYKEGNIQ